MYIFHINCFISISSYLYRHLKHSSASYADIVTLLLLTGASLTLLTQGHQSGSVGLHQPHVSGMSDDHQQQRHGVRHHNGLLSLVLVIFTCNQ